MGTYLPPQPLSVEKLLAKLVEEVIGYKFPAGFGLNRPTAEFPHH